MTPVVRVGVVSDTHGRLHPRIHDVFAGVSHVVHAGDVGSEAVLDELAVLAPVTAVLGNVDPLALGLPRFATVELAGVRFAVGHVERDLRASDEAGGADVLVVGHTHVPKVERTGKILLVNPGSPARSRGAGRTVALVTVRGGLPAAEIVRL